MKPHPSSHLHLSPCCFSYSLSLPPLDLTFTMAWWERDYISGLVLIEVQTTQPKGLSKSCFSTGFRVVWAPLLLSLQLGLPSRSFYFEEAAGVWIDGCGGKVCFGEERWLKCWGTSIGFSDTDAASPMRTVSSSLNWSVASLTPLFDFGVMEYWACLKKLAIASERTQGLWLSHAKCYLSFRKGSH